MATNFAMILRASLNSSRLVTMGDLMRRFENPDTFAPVLTFYTSLLDEIRLRMDAAGRASAGEIPTIHPVVARDLIYIELRMVCELIALACLVAHGDIREAQTGKFQKAYAADFIVRGLERLHPDFYPRPTEQILDARGVVTATRDIKSGFLTKTDLTKLYAECGNALHRGSMQDIGTKIPSHLDFGIQADWMNKIVRLLNHHQISLYDPSFELWAFMVDKDAKDGRKARAFLMKRERPVSDPAPP